MKFYVNNCAGTLKGSRMKTTELVSGGVQKHESIRLVCLSSKIRSIRSELALIELFSDPHLIVHCSFASLMYSGINDDEFIQCNGNHKLKAGYSIVNLGGMDVL